MNKNLWVLAIMFSLVLTPGAVYAEKAPVKAKAKIVKKAAAEVNTVVKTETKTVEKVVSEVPKAAEAPKVAEVTKEVTKEIVKVEEAKPVSEVWLQNPPVVKVSPFGQEIKINVNFAPKMGKEKIAAIQSVKLETDKGEFLGLKTYSPEETSREAEFMVSPAALKIDAVKIIVSSSLDGDYSTSASLVIPQEDVKPDGAALVEEGKAAVEKAAKTEEKPKKKGWGW